MILSRSSLASRLVFVIAALVVLGLGAAAAFLPRSCATKTSERTTRAPAAPRIEVQRPDGAPVALAEIAPGKRVAIVVMKGTWCRACTSQLGRLQARAAQLAALDAVVVGLTDATPDDNARTAATLGLELPILSDVDGDALRMFGLDGLGHPVPGVVFLDRDGRVTDVVPGRHPGQPQEDWIVDRLR